MNDTKLKSEFNKVAVYSGSFSPITLGHLHVIEHAAKMCDTLYVAIGHNPKKTSLFTAEERIDMIEKDLDELVRPALRAAGIDCEIKVEAYEGATVDFMKAVGASVHLRGIRGVRDFQDEEELAMVNADLFDGGSRDQSADNKFTQALIFTTDPDLVKVSSSRARELAAIGKEDALDRYVTARTKDMLLLKLKT